MLWLNSSFGTACLHAFLLLAAFSPAVCQEDLVDDADSNQLVLNVYVDESGRALINGYADDVAGLDFLSYSEHSYENESKQLYAVSSAFTSKFRDNWSLRFESDGIYSEYHIIFYLPEGAKVKEIACSPGLEYLVYASNESFVAEVQGYDAANPMVEIEYLLPLTVAAEADGAADDRARADAANYLYLTAALSGILAIGLAAAIFELRRRHTNKFPGNCARLQEDAKAYSNPAGSGCSGDLCERAQGRSTAMLDSLDSGQPTSTVDAGSRDSGPGSGVLEDVRSSNLGEGIEVTSEIAAVMNTLTDREQSVLQALLRHGGRMTQLEIRYETGISKSSLSGILTLMERRKMITRKEYGRTNAIEISDQLLTGSERL